MTEKQLREKVVAAAVAWLGCKEANGSHRKIIDTYNAHKPLARGYAVKYTDAWCATYVSAVAIVAGVTDILPLECGCGPMITLFKKLGTWRENDAYTPVPGDVIFYDWDDGGKGDNTGNPDHVGIVTAASGTTVTVIEGNKGNAVGYRTMKINGKYIRGYGAPDYAGKAKESAPSAPQAPVATAYTGQTGREQRDQKSESDPCGPGDLFDFGGGGHRKAGQAGRDQFPGLLGAGHQQGQVFGHSADQGGGGDHQAGHPHLHPGGRRGRPGGRWRH